jgi:hypothetical protein
LIDFILPTHAVLTPVVNVPAKVIVAEFPVLNRVPVGIYMLS